MVINRSNCSFKYKPLPNFAPATLANSEAIMQLRTSQFCELTYVVEIMMMHSLVGAGQFSCQNFKLEILPALYPEILQS